MPNGSDWSRTCQRRDSDEGLGRSRGGLTCKIHLASEGGCRPMAFLLTPGQWGDAPQMIEVLKRIRVPRPQGGHPRTRPDHLGGDKANSSRATGATCEDARSSTPFPSRRTRGPTANGAAARAAVPTGFDSELYKRRNEVERTINRLKSSRAVATRYDKRAYVFHGTVTTAAIRLWLRP
ncbi:IS5 family transposase [Streptomyces vinaceus]|uniref:IS5 family transposase n=1 Tax=Streptomyces vinaceus TaxID=1960 RepID=UPI0035DE00C4